MSDHLALDVGDATLPATLSMPDRDVRCGLIPLHGAEAGRRSYFLYEHLARVLPEHGVAVLRYDRRPNPRSGDVPFDVQAADALAAIRLLRHHIGGQPVGLWGWSQGAWAAAFAAAIYADVVAWLVLLSASGVSPAAQMRYGTAEQLRRRGYGTEDLAQLAELRSAVEAYLRGDLDRASAQAVVDVAADKPWFPHAYVNRQLPAGPGTWPDMDFDPVATFSRVRCPILAFYGEDDEWVPIDASIAALGRGSVARANADTEIVRLPGCDHLPTVGGRKAEVAISPLYITTLISWLGEKLRPGDPH